MFIKKSLVTVLAALLIVAVTVQAQDEAETVITPVACAEPGELTMWVWDTNWETIINESIAAWEAEYCPGATVNVVQQPWGDYWDLLRTNAAAGSMPDVLNMSQAFVDFYFENDALLNLQPYFDAAGIDPTLWSPGYVGPYTVDGDAYAAPVNWDTIALLYNKELFDQAGVDYPTDDWTWTDFRAAAEAIAALGDDIYGAATYAELQAGFGSFISSTDTSPGVTADGAECTLTSEGSLRALNFLAEMYYDGLQPSISTLGGSSADDSFNLFASGQVGMVTAGSWKLPQAIEELTFDWDIARLPADPETGIRRSQTHAVGYMASSRTENPDLAANLIIFLASDEGQRFFAEAGGVAPANPNPDLQALWAGGFADSGKNVQAYVDATQDTQGVTVVGDMNAVVTEMVVSIFDLDIPVEVAAEAACAQIEQIIAQ